ncbi:MAG: hypothetical protein E6Q50_03630 [Lysobacter sp.]|nr:MAG: hypothetical protein E6Q50_03630 [Lysobacter sp.]
MIQSTARDDPAMADIFRHTRSAEALAALRALGAEAVRRGRSPFGPLGFGVLLTDASAAARPNTAASAHEPADPLR